MAMAASFVRPVASLRTNGVRVHPLVCRTRLAVELMRARRSTRSFPHQYCQQRDRADRKRRGEGEQRAGKIL
jgi:hypothetical protein